MHTQLQQHHERCLNSYLGTKVSLFIKCQDTGTVHGLVFFLSCKHPQGNLLFNLCASWILPGYTADLVLCSLQSWRNLTNSPAPEGEI